MKTFTIFHYTFRLDSAENAFSDSIWMRSELEIDPSFFLGNVRNFMMRNNEKTIDPGACVFYQLQTNPETQASKDQIFLLHHLFSKPFQTISGNSQAPAFKLVPDHSMLGPRVMFNPMTGIGILSFGMIPDQAEITMDELTAFNFQMRITERLDSPLFGTKKNTHESATEKENRISALLASNHNNDKTNPENLLHTWKVPDLLKTFFTGLPKERLTFFSPRLHAFTYFQSAHKIEDEVLKSASFRLRRMYNQHYKPDENFLLNSGETENTFKEIHHGASIEGCAIIVHPDGKNLPPFLENFGSVVLSRYIWLYQLALFQRMALLYIQDTISSFYADQHPTRERILALQSNLSRTQLNALFTQVSHFSQHNDFYAFCKKNLKVEELSFEVKNRLEHMGRILQEQIMEAEVAQHKKDTHRDRVFEILIASLLIPEIIFEFFSTLAHVFGIHFSVHEFNWPSYIMLALIILLFLTIAPFGLRLYREYGKVLKETLKEKLGKE